MHAEFHNDQFGARFLAEALAVQERHPHWEFDDVAGAAVANIISAEALRELETVLDRRAHAGRMADAAGDDLGV